MSLLDEISAILESAGIRHALIGALALSAYGVNRATVDAIPQPVEEDSARRGRVRLALGRVVDRVTWRERFMRICLKRISC